MSRIYSFIIVGSFLVIASFTATSVHADWLIDRSGALVQIEGYILGEDDGIVIDADEVVTKATQVKLEQAVQARLKSQTALKQSTQSQLKVQEGSVMQVQQAVMGQDGQVVRRKETDFEPGEGLRLEQPDGKMVDIRVRDNGNFEIERGNFKTNTSSPISIGADNELIITRPDGSEKIVSVLPDTAADNLRSRGLAVTADEVELENLGDDLVYRFPVQEEKRFLGLFKRFYNQEAVVSAETGAVIDTTSTETSPWVSFLESLSF